MYRFVRSLRVQPGRQVEGLAWAKEIAEHFGRRYSLELRVLVEVFGDAGTLYWVSDHEDLAAIERLMGQMVQDQELAAIVNRGAELSVGGTLHDRLLRHA